MNKNSIKTNDLFDKKIDKKKRMMLFAAGLILGLGISLAAGNSVVFSAVCSIAMGTGGFFLPVLLDKKRKKKEMKLYEIDMSDYLISVSLLLSSGITLWDALRRGITGADLKKPLYRDLAKLFDGLDMGKFESPVEAFEEFAAKCGSPAVSTLTAVIVQNYRKGSGEIAELFGELAVSSRNNRKYICMKLADEATTLLLIPSTMVLIALVILLLTPAVVALTGIA